MNERTPQTPQTDQPKTPGEIQREKARVWREWEDDTEKQIATVIEALQSAPLRNQNLEELLGIMQQMSDVHTRIFNFESFSLKYDGLSDELGSEIGKNANEREKLEEEVLGHISRYVNEYDLVKETTLIATEARRRLRSTQDDRLELLVEDLESWLLQIDEKLYRSNR
jgi:hypothetical protein